MKVRKIEINDGIQTNYYTHTYTTHTYEHTLNHCCFQEKHRIRLLQSSGHIFTKQSIHSCFLGVFLFNATLLFINIEPTATSTAHECMQFIKHTCFLVIAFFIKHHNLLSKKKAVDNTMLGGILNSIKMPITLQTE